MSGLGQLDLRAKGGEARLRALLEDLLSYYKGVYPGHKLVLAIWFERTPESAVHNLLALFTGPPMDEIAISERQSLLWKTGSEEPPFVNIHATSVDYFTKKLVVDQNSLSGYMDEFEVLYFEKQFLTQQILNAFNVVTEPSGLLKGWYVSADEFAKAENIGSMLGLHRPSKLEIGLVKIEESQDYENCRGLLHAEIGQIWLPLSPGGLSAYTFYNDLERGHPGYLLFEGGSLYNILKFEVKVAPEYSDQVLEKVRDDRYPEVYLRAVHPPT